MTDGIENSQGNNPLQGSYANNFKIGYNYFEFLVDFGQAYNESQRVTFHTRVITNPVHAKALLRLLGESINEYEQNFGTIFASTESN